MLLIRDHRIADNAALNHSRHETGNTTSNRNRRCIMAVAGGAALIAMGAITAGCGNAGNEAPSTTTTPTTTTTTSTTTSPPATTAPPPPPTQKDISPTGGNLFSPQVIAPPAPTEPPGVHRNRH